MSSFWNFAFGVILIILWIIAGVYVTQASIKLTSYRNVDEHLYRAYWFTFWAAFTTWFLIGLFILLIILSVFGVVALFGSGVGEVAEGVELEQSELLQQQGLSDEGISWFTIGFLAFALILVSVTGVLAAIAATSMTESSNFDTTKEDLRTAYDDCVIAAITCLGAASILIIGTITYFVIGYIRENKIQATRKEELEEIQKLKQKGLREKLIEQQQFQQQITQTQEESILNNAINKFAQSSFKKEVPIALVSTPIINNSTPINNLPVLRNSTPINNSTNNKRTSRRLRRKSRI